MRILGNPVFLRAAVVLFCATFAFLLGLIFMRLLRKSIEEESEIGSDIPTSLETLPLHLYSSVIQQLKQQKTELQVQSRAEQQKARTSETFSQAVLANLPCGVLVFGTNGLVTSSNPAAKQILGFASATGMNAEDIFRGAVISRLHPDPLDTEIDETANDSVCLADEIAATLRGGIQPRRVQAEYETPANQKRFIGLTVSPVLAENGALLGVAGMIDDLTELDHIRRQQQSQGELSGEIVQQLRTSVVAISDYAQRLGKNNDPARAKQFANQIADEATRLDRCINEFSTEKTAPRTAAAAAGSST